MYYPGLFFIPGFFVLAFSVMQHPNPIVGLLTGAACLVAFIFQSWVWIGLALAAGIIAGFILHEANLPMLAMAKALGWALISIALAARCPRCEYNISPSRNPWARGPSRQWCRMCGRTRERVWPFQYMTKPEAWDGEYHDEGGGPASDDGVLDWWRGVLFRRIQKRQMKRNGFS